MTSTSWARVEPLIFEALGLEGAARAAFLEGACGADLELRREVETLLALDDTAQLFLERSALDEAARALHDEMEPTSLVGQHVGGYRIDALIGVGGMGDVYRARDVPLDRDVALKVLVHWPADRPADRARVAMEARAASRLNHPNIVTVHAVGEADGLGFIAMELVQGQTLRGRLMAGPLTVDEAAVLAQQMADALAAAHAEGIVHRDLKPENVMVTPSGLLKVLDFGIAGREHAGADESPIGGTAGYMSPEQADGQPARAASDQFSFGVILHEMLAGRLPSASDPIHAVVLDVSPALSAVVARCLAKRPDDRFASTDDLAAALRAARAHPPRAGLTRRRALQAGAAAVAVAAAGAWAWQVGPWSTRRRTLAVVPFRNTSGDADADYLADGLTATLIERLALMPSLAVLPRSLVFNFKSAAGGAPEIGRQLGAAFVLGGTVGRAGDRLQVSAHLDDVATGRTVWSESYDRRVGELLLVEEQIAQAIVDEGVRLKLSVEQRRRLQRRPTSDPVAYELYLEAVYLCQQEAEASYLDARDLLRDALARDPQFGAGHTQMATTYAVMAIDGLERPTEAWPESSRHVRRALSADPDLADAHASAASQEFFFNWNWDGAEDEWRLAMRFGGGELHPDLYTARALQRWALGRIDDALSLVRQARRVDPVSPVFIVREADFLLHRGDLDAAATLYLQVLAIRPDDTRALFGLADVYRRLGRFEDALVQRRRAHVAAGEPEVAEGPFSATAVEELDRIDAKSALSQLALFAVRAKAGAYVSPLDIARQHARLGQADAAASLFDEAVADRAPGLTMLGVDRAWDLVRGDARFRALHARVGLS
ncbi:MAG: protein kinase [Vicinamibacteria bacterium]|nr:protein kinase [Vicinamibacteria bacterium]